MYFATGFESPDWRKEWTSAGGKVEAIDAHPEAKFEPLVGKACRAYLAKGELTGHAHRITERDNASLWQDDDSLFLDVTGSEATLTHEEHAPITLKRGKYRVWIQREYTPQEIRRVLD